MSRCTKTWVTRCCGPQSRASCQSSTRQSSTCVRCRSIRGAMQAAQRRAACSRHAMCAQCCASSAAAALCCCRLAATGATCGGSCTHSAWGTCSRWALLCARASRSSRHVLALQEFVGDALDVCVVAAAVVVGVTACAASFPDPQTHTRLHHTVACPGTRPVRMLRCCAACCRSCSCRSRSASAQQHGHSGTGMSSTACPVAC